MSVIFSWPGFELEYVSGDLMHTADLGITQYLIANVWFELFKQIGGLVTKPQPAMAHLTKLMKVASAMIEQDRSPVARLTFAQIRAQGESPKLKCKAAETRHLLPVLLHMLRHFFPPKTEREGTRLACVEACTT